MNHSRSKGGSCRKQTTELFNKLHCACSHPQRWFNYGPSLTGGTWVRGRMTTGSTFLMKFQLTTRRLHGHLRTATYQCQAIKTKLALCFRRCANALAVINNTNSRHKPTWKRPRYY